MEAGALWGLPLAGQEHHAALVFGFASTSFADIQDPPGKEYGPTRKLGRGEGYQYPHADERGFAVDCLPEELQGTVFYEPSGIGEEVEVERSATARPAEQPRTAPE